MLLADAGEIIAHEAAFAMQAYDNPSFPLAELGDLSLGLSRQLRVLAIVQLLVNGNSDGFAHNLMRSGRSRLEFLRRAASSPSFVHHGVSGRFDAVVDLLAARQFDEAVQVGALASPEWMPDHEYEEDFCYARMLHRLASAPAGQAHLDDLLARVRVCEGGSLDARSQVCLALAETNAPAFEAAFEALLQERAATIEADKARAQTVTAEITAERLVYVEGLAMLSLADARRMPTQREYLYCPSLARLPMHTPLSE